MTHNPTRKAKLCQRACKAKAREKEILKNAPPHMKIITHQHTSNMLRQKESNCDNI
jgi:hypothetical protein